MLSRLAEAWAHLRDDTEERENLRRKAEWYALRQRMDGDVVRRTGEVIPKEIA